jgi:hypothetical protein
MLNIFKQAVSSKRERGTSTDVSTGTSSSAKRANQSLVNNLDYSLYEMSIVLRVPVSKLKENECEWKRKIYEVKE